MSKRLSLIAASAIAINAYGAASAQEAEPASTQTDAAQTEEAPVSDGMSAKAYTAEETDAYIAQDDELITGSEAALVAGTYDVALPGDAGTKTLEIMGEGDTATGTFDGEPVEIAVTGRNIEFEAPVMMDGEEQPMSFAGTVVDGEIQDGVLEGADGGESLTFSAVRTEDGSSFADAGAMESDSESVVEDETYALEEDDSLDDTYALEEDDSADAMSDDMSETADSMTAEAEEVESDLEAAEEDVESELAMDDMESETATDGYSEDGDTELASSESMSAPAAKIPAQPTDPEEAAVEAAMIAGVYEVTIPDQSGSRTLIIEGKGTEAAGTLDGEPIDVIVTGRNFSFDAPVMMDGEEQLMTFAGTVEDGVIENGVIEAQGDGGFMTFDAVRVEGGSDADVEADAETEVDTDVEADADTMESLETDTEAMDSETLDTETETDLDTSTDSMEMESDTMSSGDMESDTDTLEAEADALESEADALEAETDALEAETDTMSTESSADTFESDTDTSSETYDADTMESDVDAMDTESDTTMPEAMGSDAMESDTGTVPGETTSDLDSEATDSEFALPDNEPEDQVDAVGPMPSDSTDDGMLETETEGEDPVDPNTDY